jgi:hypothetical protein
VRWKGDVLYAENHAVGGSYVTGSTTAPDRASEETMTVPRDSAPFVALYCPGSFGIHIKAGVWHQRVYPLREFGCLLSIPLRSLE